MPGPAVAGPEQEPRERAILIGVTTKPRQAADDSLTELRELAGSAGLLVVDVIVQQRQRIDPRYLMGRGKLMDLVIRTLQMDADLLVFDAELLLHVIDLSNPRFEEQMEAVDKILATLELGGKPVLKVFNKMDLVPPELAAWQSRSHDGVAISAMAAGTLQPLLYRLEETIDRILPREQMTSAEQEAVAEAMREREKAGLLH